MVLFLSIIISCSRKIRVLDTIKKPFTLTNQKSSTTRLHADFHSLYLHSHQVIKSFKTFVLSSVFLSFCSVISLQINMADQENKSHEYETSTQTTNVEVQDRGIFDFGKKKEEEKPHGEAFATEFDEKVKISEEEKKEDEGEKKHSLLDKLHRSDSSSSSSSDEEEEGEGGEKKKKKKEKKGKEKIGGDHKEEVKHEDTSVPVEKVEVDPAHPEEKKGFLVKIKEKLPGQHKKTEDVPPPPPPPSSEYEATHESHEGEAKEKKGFLEKIKEKIPGYHPKTEEEKEKEKEKEKEGAAH